MINYVETTSYVQQHYLYLQPHLFCSQTAGPLTFSQEFFDTIVTLSDFMLGHSFNGWISLAFILRSPSVPLVSAIISCHRRRSSSGRAHAAEWFCSAGQLVVVGRASGVRWEWRSDLVLGRGTAADRAAVRRLPLLSALQSAVALSAHLHLCRVLL